MTLAEKKKKQSIAEYVLFMWQMEDLVRAVNFDSGELEAFIRSYIPGPEAFESEREWFQGLMQQMKREKLEKKGHLSDVHELMFELNFLHGTLLSIIKDKTYIELHRQAQPFLAEYAERAGKNPNNDVEAALVALYGLLLLRLKKEPVSPATEEAMKTFSSMLARLSYQYQKMKDNERNVAMN
jgi:Domain of unknown function (DUF4924)